MAIPKRYKCPSAQRRIIRLAIQSLVAQWPGHFVDPNDLRDLLPYVFAVIEETTGDNISKYPKRGQWLRTIVPVLCTAYRLLYSDEVRIAFSKFSRTIERLVPWLEPNDLWMPSVDRVLRRVANSAIEEPVHELTGFVITVAKNLFRSIMTKHLRERAAAKVMGGLATECDTEEDPLRKSELSPDEIRREMIPFCADKLKQQLRSRRTRDTAPQRVRGFASAVAMMIDQPARSCEECRLTTENVAAAMNDRAGMIVMLVPPRSTFYTWLRELAGRVQGTHGAA